MTATRYSLIISVPAFVLDCRVLEFRVDCFELLLLCKYPSFQSSFHWIFAAGAAFHVIMCVLRGAGLCGLAAPPLTCDIANMVSRSNFDSVSDSLELSGQDIGFTFQILFHPYIFFLIYIWHLETSCVLSSKVDVHSVKVPDGSLQCIILGAKTAKLPNAGYLEDCHVFRNNMCRARQ